MSREVGKQLEGLRLDFDGAAAPPQLAQALVELEITETQDHDHPPLHPDAGRSGKRQLAVSHSSGSGQDSGRV